MIVKAGLSSLLVGAFLALAGVLFAPLPAEAAPDAVLPVPALTIYPGDKIKNSYLVDRDFSNKPQLLRAGMIASKKALVGKLATRTLLPGQPIPINAVKEPDAIKNGEKVRVIFSQGGLYIQTYAIALQAGSVGQVISVRNTESGTTISGVVQSDGSVRVGG